MHQAQSLGFLGDGQQSLTDPDVAPLGLESCESATPHRHSQYRMMEQGYVNCNLHYHLEKGRNGDTPQSLVCCNSAMFMGSGSLPSCRGGFLIRLSFCSLAGEGKSVILCSTWLHPQGSLFSDFSLPCLNWIWWHMPSLREFEG